MPDGNALQSSAASRKIEFLLARSKKDCTCFKIVRTLFAVRIEHFQLAPCMRKTVPVSTLSPKVRAIHYRCEQVANRVRQFIHQSGCDLSRNLPSQELQRTLGKRIQTFLSPPTRD